MNERVRPLHRLLSLALVCVGCSASDLERLSVSGAALGGANGAVSVTTAKTLNTYAALAADAPAGATSLTVANLADLTSTTTGALAAGDLLLVIQMEGAKIDTTSSPTYGKVIDLRGAGLYEFVSVAAVGGGPTGQDITLDSTCGGLKNTYDVMAGGRSQVVRVPQYSTVSVSTTGRVTAQPWDGQKGGVIALHVSTAVFLDGKIDGTGFGFRGGALDPVSQPVTQDVSIYSSSAPEDGAEKGESIAGDASVYDTLGGRYGRGAPANGGGGGNAHNAGGGGGANGDNLAAWNGEGVMDPNPSYAAAWALDPGYIANGNKLTTSSGGGRGGYSYSLNDNDALTVPPGTTSWGGNYRRERGGLGGHPVNNDAASRLFLGGGGGAGDQNNGASGPGGAGGGLVYIISNQISGSGQVLSNGANGGNTTGNQNDGAGGGGGGGTVVVRANSLTGINIQANGGTGGLQKIFAAGTEAEGPGGGGGGGYIATFGGNVPQVATGGAGGTTTTNALTEFPLNGSTGAAPGQTLQSAAAYVACVPADLSVTLTDGQGTAPPGGQVTYTLVAHNAGPNPATGSRVQLTMPAYVNNITWTCAGTSGGVCPSSTGGGPLSTSADLPANGTVTFTIKGTIAGSATGTLTSTATVTAPAQVTDPNLANNTATDSDTLVPRADLSVAITGSPTPVVSAGGTLTYTVRATNNGPSTSSGITISDTLPQGVTYVSASGTGWTCGQSGLNVTCNLPSLAAGASSDVMIVVIAPTDGTLVDTAIVTSVTADPNAANNTGSNTTVVNAIADLDISIGASVPQVKAGQAVTYVVLVNNSGPEGAKQVVVANALPAGASFVSATGAGWTCSFNAGTVSCLRPGLPLGGAPPITIVLTAGSDGGPMVNTVTVDGASYDPEPSNNLASVTTTVIAQANLTVTTQSDPEPSRPGHPVTLIVAVDNTGPSRADQVTVTVALPPDTQVDTADGDGWSCTQNGNLLTCTRPALDVGTAPPIRVVMETPYNGGVTLRGTASATAGTPDPDPSGNSVAWSIVVPMRQIIVAGGGCGATGSGTFSALALIAGALVLLSARRRRPSGFEATLAGVLALLGASRASAQTKDAALSYSFDIQQFQPAPGASDVWSVQSPGVQPNLRWQVGAFLNYAHSPLVILDSDTSKLVSPLVGGQTELDLLGAIGILDRYELGIAIPLTLQQVGPTADLLTRLGSEFSGGGLGDIRILPKVLLWEGHGARLGVSAPILLPTGGGASFRSDPGVQVKPRLLVDYQLPYGIRVLANVGANIRSPQQLLNLVVGSELAYGLAAQVPFTVAEQESAAVVSLTGAFSLVAANAASERPLELLLGGQTKLTPELQATLGVGRGLNHGYGSPDLRVFAGIAWMPPPPPPPPPPAPRVVMPPPSKDTDGDGIPDDKDACPNEPETVNGYLDDDGCPDTVPVAPPVKVQVEGGRITSLEKVHFATAKDEILPESFPLLEQVAQVLKDNPRILRVRVEGHTDKQGDDASNVDLSNRRAANVRKRLIQDGIDPDRLEAAGYGAFRPVDTNDTPKGRENNRRVEFIIVQLKSDDSGRPPASTGTQPPPSATPAATPVAPVKPWSRSAPTTGAPAPAPVKPGTLPPAAKPSTPPAVAKPAAAPVAAKPAAPQAPAKPAAAPVAVPAKKP